LSKILEDTTVYKCRKCGRRADVKVTYAKLLLCGDHFLEYIENRVLNSIRKYKMLNNVRKILVALSGGKDSLSLLYILSRIRNQLGLDEIVGVHIDLGLGAYSDESRILVEKACRDTNIQCTILSLKELTGHTIPELAEITRRPPCSLCGLFKRYLINLLAVELGVDAVILGHHMDDILVFAIKDFLFQDMVDLAKMTPVSTGIQGFLAKKIKLLYEIYEDDLYSYAYFSKIKTTGTQCPFKYMDPFKIAIRKMLDELEEYAPGFKISIARKLAETLGKSRESEAIQPCKYCGMPSKNGVCGICNLTMKIYGEPLGPKIRTKIREKHCFTR